MTDIQIRSFLTVAKTESFSRAAELLFLSQSSVSRNVNELEKEWEFKLFDRSNNSVCLTEAGRVMYEFFSKATGKYSDALKRAEFVARSQKGLIRIGLLDGQMMNEIMRSAVFEMTRRNPGVEIIFERLDYNEIRGKLIAKELDFAEVPAESVLFDNRCAVPLYKYETYLIIPSTSKYAYQSNLSIELFLNETLILVGHDEQNSKSPELMWSGECKKHGVEPHIRYVSDIREQEILIELGEGVGVCNINHMMSNCPHTSFVKLKELTPRTFELVWNRLNSNPQIQSFISCFEPQPEKVI
ncbi:MAG: LysR family transcriptional regulator [Oscillospiraceae bacterium]|nr:LysR family transcriptional regulator [Oscillospiraceae bacterium]